MALKTVYLIGPMGAGKSTLGRILAQRLNLPFLDIDREVEMRSGVSIGWIFDKEGEEGFRQRETLLLRELSQSNETLVIATGGGSVLRPENQRLITNSGFVVFLETSVETQAERTSKDKRRPLLQNGVDRFKILSDIYLQRRALYYSLADITINTDAGAQHSNIEEIIKVLDM